MSRSLTSRLETKMPWRQTPSRKKKAIVFTTDDGCLSGSTKRWIFKSCHLFQTFSRQSEGLAVSLTIVDIIDNRRLLTLSGQNDK